MEPDCQVALDNREKVSRRYRSSPSFENFIELKKCEAKAKRAFKSSKRNAWKSFCSTINPHMPLSKLWLFVKNFKNRFLHSFCSAPPTYLTDQLQTLIHIICPPSYLLLISPSHFSLNTSSNFPIHPFTRKELSSVLNRLNLKSSPGLDRIDPLTIIKLPSNILDHLISMYNEMMRNCLIPKSWLSSLTFFIPKSIPGKFHPISLTSCLLKIMEDLIFLRLDWWVERNRFIPDFQYGFRKGRSCANNLAILTTEFR